MIQSVLVRMVRLGKILLLERRWDDRSAPGSGLPGGKVEPGETLVEAAVREVSEEAGIALDPTTLVLVGGPFRTTTRAGIDHEVHLFHVAIPPSRSAQITLSHEHVAWCWFPPRSALRIPLAGVVTRAAIRSLIHRADPDLCYPLPGRPMLPDAPGSFGFKRLHDVHTGVDLYCEVGARVAAMEGGMVVAVEAYTGASAADPSPWWNDTQAVMVRSDSRVILYGEVEARVRVGDVVLPGQTVGTIERPVLRTFKGRPTVMLHLEEYHRDATTSVWWRHGEPMPTGLRDPTPLIRSAAGFPPGRFRLADYRGDRFVAAGGSAVATETVGSAEKETSE